MLSVSRLPRPMLSLKVITYIKSARLIIFRMSFFKKAPRLMDIEERPLGMQKRRGVGFLLPHTRDHLALMPLVSGISKGLRAKGIAAETHSVEDMRGQVISLSVRLSAIKFRKKERGALETLFELRDALVRLMLACSILAVNPGGNLVELQTLGRDYRLGDRFAAASGYFRLPQTRVLHAKAYLATFEEPIGRGIRLLGAAGGDERLSKAARIFSLEESRVRPEAGEGLGFLSRNLSRAALISIPAPCFDNPYEERERYHFTEFEREYGEGMAAANTLGDEDIKAILAALS